MPRIGNDCHAYSQPTGDRCIFLFWGLRFVLGVNCEPTFLHKVLIVKYLANISYVEKIVCIIGS